MDNTFDFRKIITICILFVLISLAFAAGMFLGKSYYSNLCTHAEDVCEQATLDCTKNQINDIYKSEYIYYENISSIGNERGTPNS